MRAVERNINVYESICSAIAAMGGCKEPELCAITGYSEQHVRLAVKWAIGLQYLAINAIGEVVRTDGVGS